MQVFLSQNATTYTIQKISNVMLVRNAEKTKYMVMSQYENAGQNHNVKINNKSFERVEQFEYLGTTLMNQNSIQEEMGAD